MPTPYFNLPLYTVSDTAALDTLLNGQSSALDAALLGNIWKFSGTTANMSSIVAPKRRAGIEYFATDTGVLWKYNGSNWVTNDGGMYLIYPTGVTGGTIVNGKVVPTSGQSTLTVNGVFSSRFRSYKYVGDYSLSTSGGVTLSLMSGATAAATNYNTQYVYWSTTAVAAAYNAAAANLYLATYGATRHFQEVTFHTPALATETMIKADVSITSAGYSAASLHSTASGYDGFRLTTTGGSFTGGSFSIYGLV